ncbi:hypothetical protein [Georgenia sp. SUBG003]|uniref:hypothetical protein n=1 Tax=Georgenia sp. SUBG003 TaxID=1497974 RepID=UPI0004DA6F63|nr:hypothetical protein DA06_26485 [Georgenia sp. SUBG003]
MNRSHRSRRVLVVGAGLFTALTLAACGGNVTAGGGNEGETSAESFPRRPCHDPRRPGRRRQHGPHRASARDHASDDLASP